MKLLLKFIGIGLIACLNIAAPRAEAMLEVAASVRITSRTEFEAPLAPLGSWVEVRSYGRCWHPVGVSLDWRPYGEGRWLWTDCGWYWDCDEPWGWACYHYGRWVFDAEFGWVWVPDIEWAPAWVYWRIGGGYIGWAPCPPHGTAIGPGYFAFVEVRHFHEPVRRRSIVINDTVVINKTTETHELKRETRSFGGASRTFVINEGPGVAAIERASGSRIRIVPIQEAARRARGPSIARTPVAPQTQRPTSPAVSPNAPQASPGRSQSPASPPHAPPSKFQRSPRDGRTHPRGRSQGPGDTGPDRENGR